MSEEESNVVRLRVLNSAISGTSSGTYQCRITLSFESNTKEVAQKVIGRFQGMEMTTETTLYEEALDIARQNLADEKTRATKREGELQIQITQMLQNAALQTRELQRLQGLEEQLKMVAEFAVNPSGAVVR